MRFYSPIDMGFLEIVQFRTQNSGTQPYAAAAGNKGAFWMDSANNVLNWSDGSEWRKIYRSETANIGNSLVLRDGNGDFTARAITATNFNGLASKATQLNAAQNFSITGKATAAAVSFDGTGAVALNITALSVDPNDIALTLDYILIGNGLNKAQASSKSSIKISELGAPTAAVSFNGQRITNLANPSADQDAATKWYVDQAAQGLDPKASCRVATTTDLGGTYSSATKTMTGAAVALVIDTITLAVGDRVLVKDETTGSGATENGIYVVTVAGGYGSPWVLTRAPDFDTSADASPGSFTFIEEGNVNKDTGWVMTTNAPVALDTSALNWTQFSGAGSYTAGRGIVQNGTQFHFAQNADYTLNSIPYANGLTTIGFIAAGSANQVLRVPGAGGAPAFGAIDISQSAAVTGTLGATNGGTGQSTWATGDLLYATAANTLGKRAIGTTGYALIVSGGVPTWGQLSLTAGVTGVLPIANGGTNLTAVTNGGVLVGSAGAYAFTAAPTAGQVFLGNSTTPTWTTLTGDISTISSAGQVTIAAGAITYSKFQQIAGLSVFGNSAGSAATGGAITGTANQVLRVDSAGTTLGFGALNLASAAAVTGTLQAGNGGTGTPYAQFTGGSALRTYSLPNLNSQLAAQVSGSITGDNSTFTFNATHNLNTKNVVAAIYDSSDNQIFVDTKTFDANTVRFTFAVAPATSVAYRWVVVGY